MSRRASAEAREEKSLEIRIPLVPTIGFYLTKPPRGPSNRLSRRRPRPHLPLCTPTPPVRLSALSRSQRPPFLARIRRSRLHPLRIHLRSLPPPAAAHPSADARPVCSLSAGRGCGAALYTLINFIISHYHRRERAPAPASCSRGSCMNLGGG